MGEKRAYKPRKPGGGRKKLKPEYDAGKNLKEQMDAAVALYEEDCSLQSIANALKLNPIKVRKLLITAGVYESEVAEKVKNTFEELMLMAMFEQPTLKDTIQVLTEVQPLVAEDAEMTALVQQTIPKMQQLNEQQFKGLELEWYKPEEPNKKTGVAEK